MQCPLFVKIHYVLLSQHNKIYILRRLKVWFDLLQILKLINTSRTNKKEHTVYCIHVKMSNVKTPEYMAICFVFTRPPPKKKPKKNQT